MDRRRPRYFSCLLVLTLQGCAASGAPRVAMAEAASAEAPQPLQAPEPAPGASPVSPTAPARATGDARRGGAALVYEANVVLGVDKIREVTSRVVQLLQELDGQLLVQAGSTVTFRVPRDRLGDALAGIERMGDVLGREVRAEDVSDRYRDLEIRLRNARAVRDRLEALLMRAGNVEDSLKIEAELSRVTEEIERLTGQLAQLTHQVAFSKVTVHLQERQVAPAHDTTFRLPFPWLDTLTLGRLLDLEEDS